VKQPEPMYCEANPRYDQTPSLAKMTEIAIKLLENANNSGFFLMVESASIDKQSHARNPCGSIGEIEQLEEVVALSNRFVQLHPNTLIIVTADHSQAAQIIPEPSLDSDNLLPIYSPGRIARIVTPEGGVMRINYATTNSFSEQHTGANVPLFSNDAEGRWLRPSMRKREISKSIRNFLFPTPASNVKP
jgi:alkaline phosphatase